MVETAVRAGRVGLPSCLHLRIDQGHGGIMQVTVSSGQTYTVSSGQAAVGDIVFSGGVLDVATGGTVGNPIGDGSVDVSAAGVTTSTTVRFGGFESVIRGALLALERFGDQSRRVCHWFYFASAIPLIFFLATVQPPFSAPDEWAHFGRAYMLSRAEVLPAVTPDGMIAGHLDAGIMRLNWRVYENRHKPFSIAFQAEYRAARWDGTKILQAFSQASYFPPVYLPQTVAVLAARAADFGIRQTVLLSALVTGLVCIALSALAIRIAPFGKSLLFVIAALPMTLSLFASSSADGPVICAAMLTTAYLARSSDRLLPASSAGRNISGLDWASVGVCMTCLVATKISYLPMVLVPIAVGATSHEIGTHRSRLIAGLLVALIVIVGWNLVIATGGRFLAPAGVDGKAQIGFLLAHLDAIPNIAINTLSIYGTSYIAQMAGTLGWLDVAHPDHFHELVRVAFVLAVGACVAEHAKPPRAIRGVTLVGVVASTGLIFLSLYAIWTVVGHQWVDGVQGRYFLPLLTFLPLGLVGLWPCNRMATALGIPAMLLVPFATWLYTFRAVTMFHAP